MKHVLWLLLASAVVAPDSPTTFVDAPDSPTSVDDAINARYAKKGHVLDNPVDGTRRKKMAVHADKSDVVEDEIDRRHKKIDRKKSDDSDDDEDELRVVHLENLKEGGVDKHLHSPRRKTGTSAMSTETRTVFGSYQECRNHIEDFPGMDVKPVNGNFQCVCKEGHKVRVKKDDVVVACYKKDCPFGMYKYTSYFSDPKCKECIKDPNVMFHYNLPALRRKDKLVEGCRTSHVTLPECPIGQYYQPFWYSDEYNYHLSFGYTTCGKTTLNKDQWDKAAANYAEAHKIKGKFGWSDLTHYQTCLCKPGEIFNVFENVCEAPEAREYCGMDPAALNCICDPKNANKDDLVCDSECPIGVSSSCEIPLQKGLARDNTPYRMYQERVNFLKLHGFY